MGRIPLVFTMAPLLAGILGARRSAALQDGPGPDCDEVDHECSAADTQVGGAIERSARALLACTRRGGAGCDLRSALAAVTDEECREVVDCQVRRLAGLVGDGSTSCARQLVRAGARLMRAKAIRIRHGRSDQSVADLASCERRGGQRCGGQVAPPLTGVCTGKTTRADATACVCTAADSLSDRLLRKPPNCVPHLAPPCPVTAIQGAPKPNFVVILSDDQRWDTIDATHQAPRRPGYVMPNVKAELTDSGVTFTEAHVTTSLCCPSRASILTGQYAHNTGVLQNHPPSGGVEVFDDHCTVARWLKAAGYRTGFVGKYLNGYANLAPCIPPGYDKWFVQLQPKYFNYDVNHDGTIEHFGTADDDYSGDVMTRQAVDFIHATAGQPFFLHVSQKGPHWPATPAPQDLGLFARLEPFRPPSYAELDASDKPTWVQSLGWTTEDVDSTDDFRVRQLETLQDVDRGVAAIMQALRDVGQERNTLVIYTSDNGYSWGEHRWRAKLCPYEECIRVPLIMRYPDLAGTLPRTDDRIVLNVDFAATIADLAGVRPPELVNGVSVAPLLANTAASWRTDLLNEHWQDVGNPRDPIPTNALVKGRFDGGRWKYIEYASGETELYNLDLDPFELTNVGGDPANAALVAAMATRLHQMNSD